MKGSREILLLRFGVSYLALRQCFLQLYNLCLGEVGVAREIQLLQLRELLQTLHISQFVASETQRP